MSLSLFLVFYSKPTPLFFINNMILHATHKYDIRSKSCLQQITCTLVLKKEHKHTSYRTPACVNKTYYHLSPPAPWHFSSSLSVCSTVQKSRYQPGNHHASHFYWWPDTLVLMPWHLDYRPSASEVISPVFSRWLWPGNGTFLEVASMVVTWWIVAFCAV